MVVIPITRKITKRQGTRITDIIQHSINLNILINDMELLELIATDSNEAYNYVKTRALADYKKLGFYKVNKNPYKKQVYIDKKYVLTIDKSNAEQLELDYNLLRALRVKDSEIIKALRVVYLADRK